MGRRLNASQGLRPRSKIGIATTVVKCLDCGLIYPDPLPVPESVEHHYGVDPSTYWKPEYFVVPPDHFRHELEQIRTLRPNSRSFLDIGAGIGKTMRVALDNGFDAYGIEASKPFFEKARDTVGDRIIHSTVEAAEFERRFDVVSFGVVLEHLYDPSAMIMKGLSWLAPNGIIHIEVPDSGYLMSKLFNLYFWLNRTDYVVNISPMHSPFHLYEFTENSFQKNGERLGYEIAHLERYAGDSGIAGPLDKLLAPVMNFTKTGMGLVLYLQRK